MIERGRQIVERLGGGRTAAVLGVALLAVAIGWATYGLGLFDRTELDTIDARFSTRGAKKPPGDIAVVQIDDPTFDKLQQQWPFPRSLHAQAVDALRKDSAKAIAYDVQFTEPTTPREDAALLRAVDGARNVSLATEEVTPSGASNVFGGDQVLARLGARAGDSQFSTDPGAVLRRVPFEVSSLKSLPIVAAEQASGTTIDPGSLGGPDAWIDFRGPPGTIPATSFSDLLTGQFQPGTFRDKIVVVGASAPNLQDVHPTAAGGGLMSGPELQANAIATALDGFPLQSTPLGVDLLLIALMGIAVPAASLRLRPIWSLALGVGLAAAYLVAAQLVFNSGRIVPVVYPLLALAIAAIGTLAVHYAFGAVDRLRMRDTFARFVPAPVVEEALERSGEDLRLGGVRREGTVMFSDLRGFTTLAESLEPEQVIAVLNQYLTEMSEAIMDRGGTLVAYMGDGIMAVFGAPLEQLDHADRALAAAREMIGSRLERFNEWLGEQGLAPGGVQMGVGLNSGEVMSGNVGSPNRIEYTAVGDTTNTAARLEGMTKGTPHALFIAASTRELLRDDAGLVRVGEMDVRGRERKIEVWSVESDEPG